MAALTTCRALAVVATQISEEGVNVATEQDFETLYMFVSHRTVQCYYVVLERACPGKVAFRDQGNAKCPSLCPLSDNKSFAHVDLCCSCPSMFVSLAGVEFVIVLQALVGNQ